LEIRSFLKFDNVQIESAQSGMEALELIKKTTFTLFILDIMMKEMDGFELAQTIRNTKKYKYTPIIFITAYYTDPSDIFKGYQSGAFDYLIKPVNKTILYQRVKIFLELDKQRHEIIEQRNILIENQNRFFDFANSLADWIWEIDKDDKYIFVSDKIKEVMGYESREIIGKTPFELMTKDNAIKIKSKFDKIKSKHAPIKDLVNWNLTKTGKPICILTNGVPFFDKKNQLMGYRGVDKDITSKIKSEKELRFQAKLLQNVNDSIIYTDLEGIIQYVNEGTNYTFGYKPRDLIGNTLSLLFPEQYKDLSITELFVVIDFQPYESIWQGKNKKGDLIWLNVKINLMHESSGKSIGYIIVSKDISEQKKAEDNNIRCLISGEDNERKRIASDLHDGLGQILTASSLNFNGLGEDITLLNKKKQNQYNSGLAFLNEAIKEVRNIAHNLMPEAIEHFGLIPTITSLLNSVKKSSDFEISISENIGIKRLDNQLEINIYRITQEILNNAIKHSKAKNITFQYQIYENDFIFTYEDDGIGFDIEKTKLKEKCQGLNNITNRVKSMSGFISLNSKIGKGTSISIEMII
jgi:PAS domain S-box-containing protein